MLGRLIDPALKIVDLFQLGNLDAYQAKHDRFPRQEAQWLAPACPRAVVFEQKTIVLQFVRRRSAMLA
jgi:hypothetical protein